MKALKLSGIVLVMMALIILASGVSGFAQDSSKVKSKGKHTPEQKATKMADKMKKHLNLTDDQYTKIYNLNLDQIKWKKESKTANLTKVEKKNKKKEFKAALKSILTDDQYKKYKKKHHKSWFRRTFGIF